MIEEAQALDAFAALSQTTRLQMVRALVVAGPDGLAAGAVGDAVGASSSSASFHLSNLERAGLVTSRRESRSIIYAANYDGLSGLVEFLMRDCCQGRPEVCAPAGLVAAPAAPRPTRRLPVPVELAAHPVAADAPELVAALEGASLPTEDLGGGGRLFFAFEDAGRAVGFGGFELYGEDMLLRSVVVLPEARGQGYGHAVTEAVLGAAHKAGARRAFLLTTTAESFFQHEGFASIARAAAPASILATKQATTICSTAALLTRPLGIHD